MLQFYQFGLILSLPDLIVLSPGYILILAPCGLFFAKLDSQFFKLCFQLGYTLTRLSRILSRVSFERLFELPSHHTETLQIIGVVVGVLRRAHYHMLSRRLNLSLVQGAGVG